MRVPTNFRNYDLDDKINFVSKYTTHDLVDMASLTFHNEFPGGSHINPANPRLEDIREFLDYICRIYELSKETGEFYFSEQDFTATLVYYALVVYYQDDYKKGNHIIDNLLLPRKMNSAQRNFIVSLRKEQNIDSIKRKIGNFLR